MYLFFPLFINPENAEVALEKDTEHTKEVLPLWDDGYEGCWTWNRTKVELQEYLLIGKEIGGKWKIFRKSYSKDSSGDTVSKKLKTIWLRKDFQTEKGQKTLDDMLGKGRFRAPKPVGFIKTIIDLVTSSTGNEIILDFFAGSGTTAHAALELNKEDGGHRTFILCEQMDYIETLTRERIRKVIESNKSGEFIYCELLKYNETFMESIQSAKSSEELLKIWQRMAEGSFLNWYVNPELPEEAVKDFEAIGKEEYGLEKQKRLLAELLDKNQLYVNLSEINDALFKVSKQDMMLNKAFFGDAYNA